jgi:hypothetical protein
VAAPLGVQVSLMQVRAQQREQRPVALGEIRPGPAVEVQPHGPPPAGTSVSSVYSAGGRVLWSEQVSSGAVQVLMSYGGVTNTLSSKPALYQNWDLMGDEAAAYWAYGYVETYTF